MQFVSCWKKLFNLNNIIYILPFQYNTSNNDQKSETCWQVFQKTNVRRLSIWFALHATVSPKTLHPTDFHLPSPELLPISHCPNSTIRPVCYSDRLWEAGKHIKTLVAFTYHRRIFFHGCFHFRTMFSADISTTVNSLLRLKKYWYLTRKRNSNMKVMKNVEICIWRTSLFLIFFLSKSNKHW